MKRSRPEDDSLHMAQEYGARGSKLPRTEVERIISDKVRLAVELSDHKMKDLLERIAEVKNEPKYDARIKKLEASVLKIKRRGDAVFTYIRKLRSLGIVQSQSLPNSASSGQPLRIISGAEPTINRRSPVSGGCSGDNTSVSSAENDSEAAAGRRPKKGFWQSLRSNKQFVDLTEEDKGKLNGEATQPKDQNSEFSEQSSSPSNPPSPEKETEFALNEDCFSDQPKEEDWHSKLHPLPDTPFPKELPLAAATYNLPQKPVLTLARIGAAKEIVIGWNIETKDPHVAEMDCYHVYAAREQKNNTFSEWKCLGVIKAMTLPMACQVSDGKGDKRLCFIVVGKDIYGRFGPYSDINSVGPGQT